jgi:hypothetical protein
MTLTCAFGLGLMLGALASPLAQHLVARYAGRHWLDIKEM